MATFGEQERASAHRMFISVKEGLDKLISWKKAEGTFLIDAIRPSSG